MTDDELRGLIKKYMEIRHVRTLEELRAHTEIGSNTTFFKKWHNFKSFTLAEFLDIMNFLKIPFEEREKIFNTLKR